MFVPSLRATVTFVYVAVLVLSSRTPSSPAVAVGAIQNINAKSATRTHLFVRLYFIRDYLAVRVVTVQCRILTSAQTRLPFQGHKACHRQTSSAPVISTLK